MPKLQPKRRLSAYVPEKKKEDMTKINKKRSKKDKRMLKAETFENIIKQTENNLHQQKFNFDGLPV